MPQRDGEELYELSRDAWRLWRFMSVAHKGRDNAIKAASAKEYEASIQSELGIQPRALQGDDGLIEELAATGRFICSTSAAPMGYFVPSNPEEFVPYLEHMRSRRNKIAAKVGRAERHLDELRETVLRQPPLWIVPDGNVVQTRMFEEATV